MILDGWREGRCIARLGWFWTGGGRGGVLLGWDGCGWVEGGGVLLGWEGCGRVEGGGGVLLGWEGCGRVEGGGVLLGWEGCVKTIDLKCVSRYLCSHIVCWSSVVLAMLRS